jgi:hypothetical protein
MLSRQPVAPSAAHRAGPAGAASMPPKKIKRPTAKPAADWLGFIAPHLRSYETLGAGERQKFITQLSTKSGYRENTLRRFISAAGFLEASGLTSIPPGLKRMPVLSVETIAKISKRDPELGQQLLKGLTQGVWTTEALKKKRTDLAKSSPTGKPKRLRVYDPDNLVRVVAQFKAKHRRPFDEDFVMVRLRDWPLPVRFDAVAEPELVLSFPRCQVVVFDEAALKWGTSAQRAKREFLRSVVLAAAMFDYVIVFVAALGEELSRCLDALRPQSRERIWSEQGPPSAKAIGAALGRFRTLEARAGEP